VGPELIKISESIQQLCHQGTCMTWLSGATPCQDRPFPSMMPKGGIVAKGLLMDEFHITVYALRGLSPPDYDAIRQALDTSHFKLALRRAVYTVIRRHLPSDKVRVTVTQ
jgi:hypothetical protein